MKEILLMVVYVLSLVLIGLHIKNRDWKNLSIFGAKFAVFSMLLVIAERM